MTLPINISGVVWFAPKAIWDWEADPAASPPAEAAVAPDAGASEPRSPSPGEPGPTAMRLVFKGYTYETRFSWVFADTPLARPWQPSDSDEARRRQQPKPPSPEQSTPGTDPEHSK